MNHEQRIKLNDSMMDVFNKMCDGNPGALTACMELFRNGDSIDPDSFMGGLGKILDLDRMGIYGSDIYVLWSDICNRNVAKLITILRANQLGYISDEKVADASHRQDYSGVEMINIQELYNKVKTRLPNFDPHNMVGLVFVPYEKVEEL